jgi:hypothetical protein
VEVGQGQEKIWEDGRVGITLDKIDRTNEMPDNIPSYFRATPKQGNDFAVVYLSVANLKSVYLTNVDCLLTDTEGREYKKTLKSYTGATPRENPTANSGLYFKEGATFTFFHALPVDAEPANLVLEYSYIKSLQESVEKNAKMEIKIRAGKK